MLDFIARPFGALLKLIYESVAFQNYGIALILFTIIVRIILFPLAVKQQRSMLKQQSLGPELEAIKRNYGSDRNKMAEEQQKLFQKHNINPMSGCLTLLIQFPIIIALYNVIRNPLTYISMLSSDTITKLTDYAAKAMNVAAKGMQQINVNHYFLNHPEEAVAAGAEAGDFINTTFLRIFDLGQNASWRFWTWGDEWQVYLPLLFLPILSLVTTYLQQALMSPNRKKNGQDKDSTANTMGAMTKIMPIMTLLISFSVPSGLVFYWIIGNVLSLGQTVIINKVFAQKKEGSL